MSKIKPELEKIVNQIKQIDGIDSAWIDDDCCWEGCVSIEICVEEGLEQEFEKEFLES